MTNGMYYLNRNKPDIGTSLTKKHYANPYDTLPRDWTIVRQGSRTGKDWFYGYNTRTGDKTPSYKSYDSALQDVHKKVGWKKYAEPWGV